MDRLKAEGSGLLDALADRAAVAVREQVESAVGRLTDYVEGDGGPGLVAAVTGAKDLGEGKGPIRSMVGAGFAGAKEKVKGAFGGGKGKSGGRQKLKVTNIVESIEVGAPLRLAYDQWTQFRDFPSFMKKVENVDQAEDNKLNWKAQIFWSHRAWEATIVDQRPDERIVWRSKAEKGHVDGAVTFHELAPNLTKIVVVLEYHPQGLFEHTGNIWRAQGRRVRLELKHFERHLMTHALLDPDSVEGWRGVIEQGEVVKDHESALEEEASRRDEGETDESDGTRDADDTDDTDQDADATPEDADESEESAQAEEEPGDVETRRGGNGQAGRRRQTTASSGRRRAAAGSGRAGDGARSRRTADGQDQGARAARR
jgi:uncharacterized membrane protein